MSHRSSTSQTSQGLGTSTRPCAVTRRCQGYGPQRAADPALLERALTAPEPTASLRALTELRAELDALERVHVVACAAGRRDVRRRRAAARHLAPGGAPPLSRPRGRAAAAPRSPTLSRRGARRADPRARGGGPPRLQQHRQRAPAAGDRAHGPAPAARARRRGGAPQLRAADDQRRRRRRACTRRCTRCSSRDDGPLRARPPAARRARGPGRGRPAPARPARDRAGGAARGALADSGSPRRRPRRRSGSIDSSSGAIRCSRRSSPAIHSGVSRIASSSSSVPSKNPSVITCVGSSSLRRWYARTIRLVPAVRRPRLAERLLLVRLEPADGEHAQHPVPPYSKSLLTVAQLRTVAVPAEARLAQRLHQAAVLHAVRAPGVELAPVGGELVGREVLVQRAARASRRSAPRRGRRRSSASGSSTSSPNGSASTTACSSSIVRRIDVDLHAEALLRAPSRASRAPSPAAGEDGVAGLASTVRTSV